MSCGQVFLGENTVQYIDRLEKHMKLPQHAEEILAVTKEEIELNLASPLETKEQVDTVFGVGGWRPLPRHLILQDGKARAIDDAKAGQQHQSSICEATIVCASAEWPTIIMRALVKKVQDITGTAAHLDLNAGKGRLPSNTSGKSY